MIFYFSGGRNGSKDRGAYRFYVSSNRKREFAFRMRKHKDAQKRVSCMGTWKFKRVRDKGMLKVLSQGARLRPLVSCRWPNAMAAWWTSHKLDTAHFKHVSVW